MRTIKPSSGQEETVFQGTTAECARLSGGLPECPDVTAWLKECCEPWLVAEARHLFAGPLNPAWARLLVAARLERYGFDEGSDVTAPSRVRLWARSWDERSVDAVEHELGVRASLLRDDLLDAQEAAITAEPAWEVMMASVLRRRDDLDAVQVLLHEHRPGTAIAPTFRRLDEDGADVMAALPPWELNEEWLWRISIGLPDAWWVRALPGQKAPQPPAPVVTRHAPDFRQPWYDGNSLPFED